MKKILALVLTLLMLVPIAAFAEDFTTYTDPDFGFSISFPADWTTSSGDDGMFIAVAPDYSLNFNVITIEIGEPLSSATIAGELVDLNETFAEQFEGYVAEIDGDIVTVADLEFVAFGGSYAYEGQNMQLLQLYTAPFGTLHILTLTGNTSVEGFDSDAIDALVIEIITSFVPAGA